MPIPATVTALGCVPVCDFPTSLSEQQFFALLIDKLATEAGINLADITAGDLLEATEDGLCALQDVVPAISASPETLRAIALYLAGKL